MRTLPSLGAVALGVRLILAGVVVLNLRLDIPTSLGRPRVTAPDQDQNLGGLSVLVLQTSPESREWPNVRAVYIASTGAPSLIVERHQEPLAVGFEDRGDDAQLQRGQGRREYPRVDEDLRLLNRDRDVRRQRLCRHLDASVHGQRWWHGRRGLPSRTCPLLVRGRWRRLSTRPRLRRLLEACLPWFWRLAACHKPNHLSHR